MANVTTQQAVASIAGNLRQPVGKKFRLPRWAFILAIVGLLAAVTVTLTIRFTSTSNADAPTQTPISAPSTDGPTAQQAAPSAANGFWPQRLVPSALQNTPEAQVGRQALSSYAPRSFARQDLILQQLAPCQLSAGKKAGGGETTSRTIVDGFAVDGVIQSITWRVDVRNSYYGTTSDGRITLYFTRVAGEPKISGVSC